MKVLHLINKSGILDLENYYKLEILDCSDNNLTEIINIPDTLEELYCQYNKLIKLDNLPSSLCTLNCSNNSIYQLDNLSDNLCTLNCSNNSIYQLDNLPNSLCTLNCSNNKICQLDNLHPQNLTCVKFLVLLCWSNGLIELSCDKNNIGYLNVIPKSVKKLNCSKNQIKWLNHLPNDLTELNCSNNLIEGEIVLVPNLTNVYMQNNKIQLLNLLTCSKIKILNCENNHIKLIKYVNGLPLSLEEFIVNNNDFEWIWKKYQKILK